jgi:hypothetical protein
MYANAYRLGSSAVRTAAQLQRAKRDRYVHISHDG